MNKMNNSREFRVPLVASYWAMWLLFLRLDAHDINEPISYGVGPLEGCPQTSPKRSLLGEQWIFSVL